MSNTSLTGIATITDDSGFTDGGSVLTCPVCGLEYTHPTGVRVNPAGESGEQVTIDRAGVHTSKADTDGRRGIEIELQFECESGHVFRHRLEFYKGFTFITTGAGASAATDDRTIWRN